MGRLDGTDSGYVGRGHVLRIGGVVSHKGDHSLSSEILLGRRKSGGGEGGAREDDKGDHDGFAIISCGWEKIIESNSTSNGGDGSTLVSGLEMDI